MGYRSNVRVSTTPKGYEAFVAVLEAARRSDSRLEGLEPTILKKDEYGVVFGWDEIKWYFDETDTLEELIKEIGNKHGEAATFVRVGEDAEDIDVWESPWPIMKNSDLAYPIYPVTQIEVSTDEFAIQSIRAKREVEQSCQPQNPRQQTSRSRGAI